MEHFTEIKGKLGFGCMRFPLFENEKTVDKEQVCKMVDTYMQAGFNYFDTAHNYYSGKSEDAVRDCVVKRYPRDSFLLTNKLTADFIETEEDVMKLFNTQLEVCGVEYFDFYLVHCITRNNYDKFKRCRAFEQVKQLKAEGKIRHFGFSFHDTADFLDKVITENPDVECVQIQFNYLDYDDLKVQSRLCYEVCEKHDKAVIVMEPVKGGELADRLSDEAKAIFAQLGSATPASYAIRFAASFKNVFMVLSGMSNLEQTVDNISYMKEFIPIEAHEHNAINEVVKTIRKNRNISCTGCSYCVAGCPVGIQIPALFECYNTQERYKNSWSKWDGKDYYNTYTANGNKASDCVKCGACEYTCPQHLDIRDLLEKIAQTFEA